MIHQPSLLGTPWKTLSTKSAHPFQAAPTGSEHDAFALHRQGGLRGDRHPAEDATGGRDSQYCGPSHLHR